jgi:putative transposase
VYQLIWCPKRRKQVLVGAVGERLHALIIHVCERHGWHLRHVAIQPDQVHLVVRAYPTTSAADIVTQLKGSTSHALRAEFPSLHTLPSLWTRSSFASTARTVSSATIGAYIEAQKGV